MKGWLTLAVVISTSLNAGFLIYNAMTNQPGYAAVSAAAVMLGCIAIAVDLVRLTMERRAR